MRFSIKLALVGVFVGLQLATVAMILFSSFVTTEDVLLKHARQLMVGVASNIIGRSEGFLRPAQAAADLTQKLADNDILTSSAPAQLERYLYEQLRVYPQFAGIYFGDPAGQFFYVNRSDEKGVAGFRTKFITNAPLGRKVELIWRDKDFAEFERALTPQDPYDPRKRPWYKKAMKERSLIWTDPYVFYTSRQPGITVASPVFGRNGTIRGVVGVDIEITEISAFLAQNRIAPGSSAFILNRNGDVIAFPDSDKIKRPGEDVGGGLRFTKIDELDDAPSRAAFASLAVAPEAFAPTEPAFTSFTLDGRAYHAVFAPFSHSNWPWTIGVYVPESHYLGAIKANRELNIYLAIVIAGVTSLVGWTLAGGIAGPLRALGARARAITREGLAPAAAPAGDNPSLFREVEETAAAFTQMVDSLKEQERTNNSLTNRLRRLSRVVEKGPVSVIVTDSRGRIEYVNPRFTEMTGYTLAEAVGKTPAILKSGRTAAHVYQDLWQTIEDGHVWHGELYNRHKNGHFFWVALTVSPLREGDEPDAPVSYIGISEDITPRKRAEADLHRLNEELEQRVEARTHELKEEIAERSRIEAALRAAKEQADEANRAKSQFLSSMSHELRTPMNAILGFGQLLATDDEPMTETQREYVQHIIQSGRHLLELINQVLELAKIEAGKVALSVEPVDCETVLAECLPVAGILAERRQIAIRPPAPEDQRATVMADFTRLKQILLNLLSNAIKYNRDGGTVTIDCRIADGGRYRISVSDTGEGIPDAFAKMMFKPFQRIHVGRERIEGTGIGLAITKQLVELMDGQIGFESEAGRGSTFWFELPLADQPARHKRPRPIHAPGAAASLPDAATILYIEDNPANLRLMEEILGRLEGGTLLSAHNAEMGVVMARAHRPDLIIMDINLPQMDGFAALKQLRDDPQTADIPVIALTANAMPGDRERALAAGFLAYLSKPIDIGEVTRTLSDALTGAS